MVQAQDLRLGNLLNYVNEIVVVSAIFKSHFNCERLDGVVIGNSHQNRFEPIELSPKILEAAGFTIDSISVHNYKRFNLSTTETCYDIMDGYFEITSTQNDMDGKTVYNHKCVANIKYLHELQNLFFALTKEELTIDINALTEIV